MSNITAPNADDWVDDGLLDLRHAFQPPSSLPDSGYAQNPDEELRGRLVFGPVLAPCCEGCGEPAGDVGQERDGDISAASPSSAAAQHHQRVHAANTGEALGQQEPPDATAAAGTELRTAACEAARYPGDDNPVVLFAARESESELLYGGAGGSWAAGPTSAPATAAAAAATGAGNPPGAPAGAGGNGGGSVISGGEDESGERAPPDVADLSAHGGGASGGKCLITRPPMPPADAVLPVVEELAEMVHEHVLEPINPPLPTAAAGGVAGEEDSVQVEGGLIALEPA
ncbi:hypothetical protein GPECTOR_106g137 [Gonium pectorale]|uniref:Uncharacterized protein n=1 Tax=Gonium pectorale TaxID=33097 RepID=A0A150FZJ7_GONPE|nr:hypothetical protein GPECTOR_106g137 [Gonium pectorale]|eukprot:KXZ43043.1 hypothetical protein GPECTOR_106g137 [Gonium pectorale]